MKKHLKRIIALTLSICLLFVAAPNAFAGLNFDIDTGLEFEKDVVSTVDELNQLLAEGGGSSGFIELSAGFSAAGNSAQIVVPAFAEATLDLHGNTLTRAASSDAWFAVCGSLTVTDSVGGGSITADGGAFAVDGGKLCLEKITLGTNANGDAISISGSKASVTVDGATVLDPITTTSTKANFVSGWYIEKLDSVNAAASISVANNATELCYDAPNAAAPYSVYTQPTYTVTYDLNLEEETVTLTSGGQPHAALTDTFSHGVKSTLAIASTSDYNFAGWNTKADGTGTAVGAQAEFFADITLYAQWTPKFTAAVQKNGGICYPTIEKAFAKAKSGDTLKLVNNISENIVMPDFELTIDLNGYTLTPSAAGNTVTVPVGATLTVTDHSVSQNGCIDGQNLGRGVYVNGGSFVLQGGTVTSTASARGNGVFVNAGSFTMEGGIVDGNIARESDLLSVSLKAGKIAEQTDDSHLAGVDSILNMLAENRILVKDGDLQRIIEKFVSGAVSCGEFSATISKAPITGTVKIMVAAYEYGQFVGVKTENLSVASLPTEVSFEVDDGTDYQMFVLDGDNIPYYSERMNDLKDYELVYARGYWTNTQKGYEGSTVESQDFVSTQRFTEDTLPEKSVITVAEGKSVRMVKWSSYPLRYTETTLTDTFTIDGSFWNGVECCAFDYAYSDDYLDVISVSVPGDAANRRDMTWNDDETLAILCIGNSFSEDALAYVWNIAKAAGVKNVVVANLYYGSCTVEQHYGFVKNNQAVYDYQLNTNGTWVHHNNSTWQAAFGTYDWDFISFQESAQTVHSDTTRFTHLGDLISMVKAKCPTAKLLWHEPWANGHQVYQNDREKMLRDFVASCRQVFEGYGFDEIITTGIGIANARTSYVPDGNYLRDGWHLTFDYGRFIAGLTFFAELTNISVEGISFAPAGLSNAYKRIAIEAAENARLYPRMRTQSVYTTAP